MTVSPGLSHITITTRPIGAETMLRMYLLQRFNALYPQYKGKFARRIVCTDDYAQTLIDVFKAAEKWPQIAVSVDMMD